MDGIGEVDAGVPFSGSLSYARYVQIQRALTPWWGRLYMTWIFLYVLQIEFSSHDIPGFLGDPVEVLTAAIVCTFGVAFLWGLTRWFWRRSWRKGMALHGKVTGTAEPDHILWRTQLAKSQFQWQKFSRVRAVPDLLLLYYTPRCALYFPREFFANEGQWVAFRSLVDSKLPSR